MNLGRKGANKAQERAQTLAHGHPLGLGRSLTVILLSLLQRGWRSLVPLPEELRGRYLGWFSLLINRGICGMS